MVNDIARKIIAGDPYRKTRLHDEKGNLLPASQWRHLPVTAWWAVRRKVTGRLPELPWLTFDAIARLDALLERDWRMIEFGSGMSTKWYAERVAHIHSIEGSEEWYLRVAPTMPSNTRYELRTGSDYWDLSDYDDRSVDLAVIDGVRRDRCMDAVIPKIRPGGYIYLDNSDKDMQVNGEGLRHAETALRAAVTDRGGTLEQASGLTVGQIVTNQWTLARL